MLDFSINYILDRKDEIMQKLMVRYSKNLTLRGKQDVTLGLYIKILLYSLQLTYLGYNTRLELYKKLLEALRKNGLMFKIPEPPAPSTEYPYYYGAGVPGLTPIDLQDLGVDTSAKEDKIYTYTNVVDEVYYVAYPAYYGSLTSILDLNGFETIDGWDIRQEDFLVTTGEGDINVSYFIYEFSHITSQVSFDNTFKY